MDDRMESSMEDRIACGGRTERGWNAHAGGWSTAPLWTVHHAKSRQTFWPGMLIAALWGHRRSWGPCPVARVSASCVPKRGFVWSVLDFAGGSSTNFL